jgi:hypothetical protein
MGLVANCGGDDSSSTNPPTAGTHNSGAGEGGEGATSNKGGSSSAGSSTAGTTMAMAGEGGTAPMAECAKDADCGATAKCVDGACKKNDGESCTASAECQNACIDGTCTAKLDDGMPCTADAQCAHTCIDGACAPVSDVGGDCDADLGAGGAGGAGSVGTGGAGGDSGGVAQNPDCKSPLTCVSGKCLTPDGEACTDNVDCINTCVKNVCQPKSTIDGACDDKADCAVAALVCDETNAKCKLDLLQQCTDNGQCKSDNCVCSNANCTVRVCKNANANCLCKWSPTDSAVCTAQSANLNAAVEDPQGCTGATNQYCNQGQCVANVGGDCVNPCKSTADDPNTPANEATCTANGAPTGCNPGYHATVTAQCAFNKAVCGGTCKCDLN